MNRLKKQFLKINNIWKVKWIPNKWFSGTDIRWHKNIKIKDTILWKNYKIIRKRAIWTYCEVSDIYCQFIKIRATMAEEQLKSL